MKFLHTILLGLCALSAASLAGACGGDGEDKPVTGPESITVGQENTVNIGSDGGVIGPLTVTATGEWDVACEQSWVRLVKEGTTLRTGGTVTVTVDANNTRQERTATLVCMSGRARANVTIVQAGKAPVPVDPTINVPEGYELVWNDEFDRGTTLGSDWRHEVQGPGWVNNELQTYVNGEQGGRRVTEITDGHLTITAFRAGSRVYSGRVYAMENTGWKYGIFEAAIRLPKGKGTWPAFWMMPANNNFATNPWPRCGEIDIMEEVGYHPEYTSSSIHCQAYNHTIGTQRTAERLTAGSQEDYHIYRLEWTPDYIETSVDGVRLLRFDNDGKGNVSTWPFDKPFYIILNLAWGGDWGGAQGVDESCLPATMDVEYVRVFQKVN